MALLAVFILPIAIALKAALAALLLSTLAYYLHQYVFLLGQTSPVALRMEGADVFLISRVGRELEGVILNDTLVTPSITILNIRLHETKKRSSVVIFADSMNQERFRELRVMLKWRKRFTQ